MGQQFPEIVPLPTLDDPIVLHLFGTEEEPASMVITQDDHLDYLALVSRDHEHLLPASVQKALTQNTLLFLGYRLRDLDLKVITRGLLRQLKLERYNRLRVVVQIEDSPENDAKKRAVMQYIQNYYAKAHKAQIDVYWGTTHQFIADLYARWQEFVERLGDDERNA